MKLAKKLSELIHCSPYSTTSKDGKEPHEHEYEVDQNGNGITSFTIGKAKDHVHKITNWKVGKAGPDKHSHDLPGERIEDSN